MGSEPEKSKAWILVIVAVVIGSAILAGLGHLASRLAALEERLGSLPVAGEHVSGSQTTHTVYVPAYSHVYSDAASPNLVAVSLHIRSTDPYSTISLTRADYYDTKGKLLRRYVKPKEPRQLHPLESVAFIVEKTDYAGGSGANFIVQWRADGSVNAPQVEAVMVGLDPNYSFSFARSGIPVTGFPIAGGAD